MPPPLPASCSRTVCPLPHQLTCSSEVPVTEVGGVSREVPTRVSEPPVGVLKALSSRSSRRWVPGTSLMSSSAVSES